MEKRKEICGRATATKTTVGKNSIGNFVHLKHHIACYPLDTKHSYLLCTRCNIVVMVISLFLRISEANLQSLFES